MIYTNDYDSPLGKMLMACNERLLTGLWFYGQKNFAANLEPGHKKAKHYVLDMAKRWLDIYFSGKSPNEILPSSFVLLNLYGTVLQVKIWQALTRIPYGETRTYSEIASQLNISPRAAGSAVSKNNIAIIIPCHRVIGSDGDLRGYSGGLERKIKLLSLEGVKIEVREKHFVR